MTARKLLAIPLLAALALGACGGGKKDESATSATTARPGCGSSAVAGGDNSGPEQNVPGDIPDDVQFVAYSPPSNLYTIKTPEGWQRTENGNTVTFTDKFNTVKVEIVDRPTVPTADTAAAEDVPAIRTASKCFEEGKIDIVTRKGGHPVHITYKADAAPDPVTGKVIHDDVERYLYWRNGKEAIVTLSGAVGSDNVDPWKIVTDSFAWK